MKSNFTSFCLVLALLSARIVSSAETPKTEPAKKEEKKLETITLAGGCFWCVEAALQRIKGVETVKSGYSGGTVKNPTYEQVCAGTTGHAEATEVTYDPKILPTEKLIEFFFELHDPTTLNRQGADVGTQYRSAIFYHTDEQKKVAEAVKKKLTDDKKFANPIVTEITKFSAFYPAEEHHQDFYNRNPNYGYCRVVIAPKLKKLGLETK